VVERRPVEIWRFFMTIRLAVSSEGHLFRGRSLAQASISRSRSITALWNRAFSARMAVALARKADAGR